MTIPLALRGPSSISLSVLLAGGAHPMLLPVSHCFCLFVVLAMRVLSAVLLHMTRPPSALFLRSLPPLLPVRTL